MATMTSSNSRYLEKASDNGKAVEAADMALTYSGGMVNGA
jgi:hypothetical protein